MFKFLKDITNLYSSRDGLWKELTKLQQTSKRRHKELLQRIHNLECKYKHDQSRGKNEAFEAYQTEEDRPSKEGTYSEYYSKGDAHVG